MDYTIDRMAHEAGDLGRHIEEFLNTWSAWSPTHDKKVLRQAAAVLEGLSRVG